MHKGFTLIELLIVVIIVGILVTVALPQYKRAVERSRATVGVVAVREAADRLNAWYIQHNNQYPTSEAFDSFLGRLELVGVGNGELFTLPYFLRSAAVGGGTGGTFAISRNSASGWNYGLQANLQNGELISITCTASSAYVPPGNERPEEGDCVRLGLTGNLANL